MQEGLVCFWFGKPGLASSEPDPPAQEEVVKAMNQNRHITALVSAHQKIKIIKFKRK